MSLVVTQDSIDYINQAYKRVCADTRLLKKRVAQTLTASSSTISLLDEVVRIEAAYVASTPIEVIGAYDYMRLLSQTQTETTNRATAYAVIGRTLYFWPALQAGDVVTLTYSYRPADINSTTTFAVTGMAERLVERLASAYFLMDDGQPELAQRELADYLTDMQRLRRRDGRREGDGGQLVLVGRRRRSV